MEHLIFFFKEPGGDGGKNKNGVVSGWAKRKREKRLKGGDSVEELRLCEYETTCSSIDEVETKSS